MTKGNKKNIAIFISGAGSNAVNIIQHFTENSSARITHIFSNRPEKGALKISENENVSLVAFNKADFLPNGEIYKTLLKTKIDYIVLAGFLLKIPEALIQMFPDRIVNIHPALLPKYGGKGMYGKHVHQAVADNNENESGVTIHLVNEQYDEGNILIQFKCDLDKADTPEVIEQKVRTLEHKHFAPTIEKWINNEI